MITLSQLLKTRRYQADKGVTFIYKRDEEHFVSYQNLYGHAAERLAFFQQIGLKPGDELIFQIEHIEEFIITFWACILGGIVAVPLTVGSTADQKQKLFTILSILKNPFVVISERYLQGLQSFSVDHGLEEQYDFLFKRSLLLEQLTRAEKTAVLFEAMPDDIAYVQFSSGSTGNPKGVILTHRNLMCNLQAAVRAGEYRADDVMLSWMPLTHDMGLIGLHLSPLYTGMSQCLIPTANFVRNPALWLDKASEHGATLLASPNFGYKYLLKHVNFDEQGWDLSAVRIIYNGAEPISEKLCAAFVSSLARFGLKPGAMRPVYGLAEATLAVTMSEIGAGVTSCCVWRGQLNIGNTVRLCAQPSEGVSFVNVGPAIDHCAVRIVDDQDKPLPEDTVGHIQVKGGSVTTGYYNNEVATDTLFSSDGWLRTGDAGFVSNKCLYVTGRIKDIFFVNGQNYYPHDIERLAEEIPGVELNKVAVAGLYNDATEQEELLAFVFHRGDLKNFIPMALKLREHITLQTGLLLDKVLAVTDMPRTTSGKLQRFRLLELYRSGYFKNQEEELAACWGKADKETRYPASETEQRLLHLWNQVFSSGDTSIAVRFSEAGGNSLKATMLCMLIHREFNRELLPAVLYEKQTLRAIAAVIDSAGNGQYFPIPRAHRQSTYPLAASQRRIYYAWQANPDSVAYHIPTAFLLEGEPDIDKLESCINILVSRHEALRMVFVNPEDPQIRVHDAVGFKLTRLFAAADEEKTVLRQFIKPFDLEKGPLFRGALLQTSAQRFILFFDFHHIIADGLSVYYFIQALIALYRGEAPVESPVAYTDFVLWENSVQQQAQWDEQKSYWRAQLRGELPLLNMPADHARPVVFITQGARKAYTVDKDIYALLINVAKEKGCTLHVLLFTVYFLLLHKYTRQKDIVIGIPVAGRKHPDLLNMLGMFVNNLAVRVSRTGEETFGQLLETVKKTMSGALHHQAYPFDHLVNDVYTRKSAGRQALFDTMFIYQNMGLPEVNEGAFTLSLYFFDPGFAKYDISMEAFESKDALSFQVEYATALFSADTIERFARGFLELLKAVATNAEAPLKNLSPIQEEDYHSYVDIFNATKAAFPLEKAIHQLFESQVEKTPQQVALVFEGEEITYQALNRAANQLAARLQQGGLVQQEVVGILLPRSPHFIISVLAVLKAGGCYLPIDTEMPSERIAYILNDSRCVKLITTTAAWRQLQAHHPVSVLAFIPEEEVFSSYTDSNPAFYGQCYDSAYVIYTSGTTGGPKGVVIMHRSLVNYATWAAAYYAKGEQADFPFFTSVAFDLTITSIFLPLITGHKIIIYPDDGEPAIQKVLRDNRVQVVKLTPSHLRLIKEQIVLGQPVPDTICRLVVGGEALDTALAQSVYHLFGGALEIFNEYGPTEATVGCMLYSFDPADTTPTVPIGVPAANTQLYLLDEDLQPVPQGVHGDLYISGEGLAKEYLYSPALTRAKFIDHPFIPGRVMYHTGDLARRLADGNIIFVGRADTQVKISGYRVELAEIERCLAAHPDVQEVAVKTSKMEDGRQLIYAYYKVTSEGVFLQEQVLKNYLAGRLPYYMTPARLVRLKQLPLTQNGKVDYDSLPVPETPACTAEEITLSETEQEMLAVWKDILQESNISVHHNFFELGGDSIKAVQIAAALAERGVAVEVKDILTYGTISQINLRVKTIGETASYEQEALQGTIKFTPIISWFFSCRLAVPGYFMQSIMLEWHDDIEVDKLEKAFETIIMHHDTLRLNYNTHTNSLYYNEKHEQARFVIQQYDVNDGQEIPGLCDQVRRGLNFSEDLLIRAAVFWVAGESAHLFVTAHHLVMDGISWRIMLEDMLKGYHQLLVHQPVSFPRKTAPFSLWANRLHEYCIGTVIHEQEDYWRDIENTAFKIPLDFETDNWQVSEQQSISRTIGRIHTQYLLKEANRVYKTDIAILLNVTLVKTLREWTGFQTIVIEEENHGRHLAGTDVSRTVGWFTAMYPVKFEMPEDDTLTGLIKAVKESMRKVPDHGLGYGLLKYARNGAGMERIPLSEVRLNYLGQLGGELTNTTYSYVPGTKGSEVAPENNLTTRLELLFMIVNDVLRLDINFNGAAHREETVVWFADRLLQNLGAIIEHLQNEKGIHFTPSDFEHVDLDEEELNSLFLE